MLYYETLMFSSKKTPSTRCDINVIEMEMSTTKGKILCNNEILFVIPVKWSFKAFADSYSFIWHAFVGMHDMRIA